MKKVVMLLLVIAFLVGTIPLSEAFCEESSVQDGSPINNEDPGTLGAPGALMVGEGQGGGGGGAVPGGLRDPVLCGGGQTGGGGGPSPGGLGDPAPCGGGQEGGGGGPGPGAK